MEELVDEALDKALLHGITFYDALYVALAEKTGQPLYTYDTKLANRLKDDDTRIRTIMPEC